MKQQTMKKKALVFLLLIGIISMLSDFTHEGARSIYGPFLSVLGVSAFLVAFTSGLGEFIGQTLRIVTGIIADKTKKYWSLMIVGYAINLLVIPLLMFVDVNIWQLAIVLILLERVGKGIRAPAKSALTSFTTPHLGAGKAFALQEAMDQFGAFLGPLFVFIVLQTQTGDELSGYQLAFGLLGIFAIMTISMIFVARWKYPNPDMLETKTLPKGFKGNKSFVLYMVAISFIALGFIDYPILAFHMGNNHLIAMSYVPLLYSIAMGVDAIAALIFGYLFDKVGVIALVYSIIFAILYVPIFFLFNNTLAIVIGVVLWGIAMGAQESILKAVISKLVSKEVRGTAYGIFYTVFGVSWFLGSMIVGYLYEISILAIVVFTTAMELLAIFFLLIYHSKQQNHKTKELDV
ncbi:MAG TPA: MFS transporter [Bacilli bacterium]|nr:MFS transporter [Bacilli bacterium]